MSGNRIANTPKHKMHALAFQGILATDCYPQLRDMLRRNPRFGDAYVLLFAEPVRNPDDNTIDWYSPVQGASRQLTQLPPEEQNVLRDKLAAMARDLQSFAFELKHEPDPSRAMRGHILELALRYPDESCLYVVGGQPVFTCWGFGPGTPGAEPQDLCRLSRLPLAAPKRTLPPEPPAAPAAASVASPASETPQQPQAEPYPLTPPPSDERAGFGWLWWLLPLLLLLLLIWVLLTSFGIWPALSGFNQFHAPALPFSERIVASSEKELNLLREENETLAGNLAALKERLAVHAEMCRSAAAPKPKDEMPAVPANTPPLEPASPEKSEEALVIPEKPADLSFLKGRWRCETGLANSRTNEPLVVEFIFDENGKGTTRVYEKNAVCQGTATAELTPDGLRILASEALCGSGRNYTSQAIDCSRHAGAALCTGKGGRANWDARFLRLP